MNNIACTSCLSVIRPFPIIALPWWRRASTSCYTVIVWPRGFAWAAGDAPA